MTPTPVSPSVYTASCNPPRRAKRSRKELDSSTPSTATLQHQLRPHLLPKESQPANSPYHESTDDEDDYDPVVPAPAPKRRGRKPGPMSRSVRESQRKLNHSRIEKARRTKINETLSTLSNLVNEAEKEKAAADPSSAAGQPVSKEGGEKGEKEFKLDVLVKTVTYLQELIQKVKTLESRTCSKCLGGSSNVAATAGVKRRRSSEDIDDEDVEIVEVSGPSYSESPKASLAPKDPTPPLPARQPAQSPCLPPISAWLPHPYVDPSYLSDANLPSSSNQLPTPPLSGSFRMPLALPSQTLPSLSLPGPAHPLSSYSTSPEASKLSRITMAPIRRASNASMRSPPVSPAWTPEDETAASLLLQMSSSPASSVSGSSVAATTPKILSQTPEFRNRRRLSQGHQMRAETPSSLLGLGKAA